MPQPNNKNGQATSSVTKRAQLALRSFFEKIWVEFAVAILVLASVVLTLLEMMLDSTAAHRDSISLRQLSLTNDIITCFFVVELTLRYFAASSKRRFFREYWIDILAVLPLFRVFRSARALRLLRLFRVLRLFGIVSRLSSHYPDIFRRGAIEYFVVCGLLVVTITFGTVAIMFFERNGAPAQPAARDPQQTPGPFTFESSFWFSVYSLFAGEPVPQAPQTLGGKVVTVFVMFMGLTIFAMFTGTVSAFMVDRFRMESRVVECDDMEDHVVICGWNSKTEIIIQEYRASKLTKTVPIAVISEVPPEAAGLPAQIKAGIAFLNDDFTRVSALERAGIHRAQTCIILSDTSGGRSEQDADARTILAALTVEKINPSVYTCAELLNRSYGTHLKMGHVNDYVVSGEYSAYMLAQSAMNRGLMGVVSELLTYQRGNEFYRLQLPDAWIQRSFNDMLLELKQNHNAILVAVHPKDGPVQINPQDYQFASGDEIVVIADKEIQWQK